MDQGNLPWRRLTQVELRQCLPPGTLPTTLRTWEQLEPAILQLPQNLQAHIQHVVEAKQAEALQQKRESARRSREKQREIRHLQRERDAWALDIDNTPFRVSLEDGEYMKLPNSTEVQACVTNFCQATGNEALKRYVCVVCARLLPSKEGM